MPRSRRPARPRAAWATATVFLAAAALTPAAAEAKLYRGAANLPQNSDLAAGYDLVRIEGEYEDVAGTVRMRFGLRGAPVSGSLLSGSMGKRRSDGRCYVPAAMMISTATGASGGWWERRDANGSTTASGTVVTRTQSGNTVTLTVTTSKFAGQGYNCIALFSTTDTGARTHDVGPHVNLAAVAPPPAPRPPPAPTPPAPPVPPPAPQPTPMPDVMPPAPAPAPTEASPAPVPPAPIAGLGIVAEGAKVRTVGHNRWTTVTLRVSNGADSAAQRARLVVKAPRGVGVRVVGASRRAPERRVLDVIEPNGRRTVTVRLRLRRGGPGRAIVRFVAAADGVPGAADSVTLRLSGNRRTDRGG